MGALADDLRAFLERRVVRAYASGALAELSKWVERNRALAAAAAIAVLALVLGSLWIAKVERDGRRELMLASDVSLNPWLRARADELWPAHPSEVPAMQSWIAEAEALRARAGAHTRRLAALERAGASTLEERLALERQRELVRTLATSGAGLDLALRQVEERMRLAGDLAERSVAGARARERWGAAAASIADVSACPQYGGLRLAPQLDLLPIGRDPRSGLWEFAHLPSGDEATRDEQGELVLRSGTGLVLVLLPGGRAVMGAQSTDPALEHFDPMAKQDEAPPHAVELAPFFLAKHEMTQAQWARTAGSNPSQYAPGSVYGAHTTSDRHPVEQISWIDAVRVLGRLGLTLPSEAQWEYAARGGTATPWWTGAERETLAGAANLADRAFHDNDAPADLAYEAWDDGWVVHAPVGSFRPNPFGLHDVHGNVWEWCLDAYASYAQAVRAGDAARGAQGARTRVYRGGDFIYPAGIARSSQRIDRSRQTSHFNLGARPARAIDG